MGKSKNADDSILDSVPCGFARFESSGRIIQVNTTLCNWIDRSKQDLIGKNVSFFLPKSGQIFWQSHIMPELKLKGELEECYFKLSTAKKQRIPVLANFRCSCQREQEYDVVLFRIQKRYQLEDALIEAKRQADVATKALQYSNETLTRFAGMVAHDLKAPIRNMKRLAEFIIEDYQDLLDEDGQNLLEKLQNAANRGTYFIDRLLEYASLDKDRNQFTKVDLNQALNNACKNLTNAIDEASALININSLPTVWGNQTQLEQLFQNLLGNAIKYRHKDRPLAIEISATQSKDKDWRINVIDNGIGVAPLDRERIFKMMTRLHGQEYEGTGIGLATCKWIVHNHQGTIGVESNDREGCNFYFILPATSGSNVYPAAPS